MRAKRHLPRLSRYDLITGIPKSLKLAGEELGNFRYVIKIRKLSLEKWRELNYIPRNSFSPRHLFRLVPSLSRFANVILFQARSFARLDSGGAEGR